MPQLLRTKSLSLIFLVVLLLQPGLAFSQGIDNGPVVNSAAIPDSGDSFAVSQPAPNSRVAGRVNVVFDVVDDELGGDAEYVNTPFEVTLRDSATCVDSLALIAQSEAEENGQQVVRWETQGPYLDTADIDDGTYCLQVCVGLNSDPGSVYETYTACNARMVTIRNSNSEPEITSSIPADRTINIGETWSYDVDASDADGDDLRFNFTSAPSFLQLNTQTGVISSRRAPSTAGYYGEITVIVEDNFGGRDTQKFDLRVVDPNPDPQPPESEEPSDSPGQLEIIEPQANATLTGGSNDISWSAADEDGIDKFNLYYFPASDPDSKQLIFEADGNIRAYSWDVAGLESGEYRLQIAMEDNEGNLTKVSSDSFIISNDDVEGVTTRPLIINVSPEENSEITQLRPVIAGEFSQPLNAEIDLSTFEFRINDEDRIAWCTVLTESGFQCEVEATLQYGVQNVEVKVEDTSGQTAQRNWTFSTVDPASLPQQCAEGEVVFLGGCVMESTLALAVVVCVIFLVLFLVPWLLYLMWRRRQQTYTTSNVYTDEPSYPSYAEPNVEVNYVPTETGTYDYGLTPADLGETETTTQEKITYPDPRTGSVAVQPEANTVAASASANNIDPADYDTYEQYLQAMGVVNDENISQDERDLVVTPDYGEDTGKS